MKANILAKPKGTTKNTKRDAPSGYDTLCSKSFNN